MAKEYIKNMFVNEAKAALKRHSGGGGGSGSDGKPAVIEPLAVTENGTYEPPEGVDGYSPVTADVQHVIEPLEITENGTYGLEEGVDGYSPVTVNVVPDATATKSKLAQIVDRSIRGELTAEDMGDITEIRSYAFSGCRLLKNVVIPNSVTSIGVNSFQSCTGLVSITIPENVTHMQPQSFQGCYKLVEVINKSSLNLTAGSGTFSHSYTNVKEVHNGPSKIVNKNGFLFYTYDGVNYLMGYAGDNSEINLPENYEGEAYVMHDYALAYCDLVKAMIVNGIKSIPLRAFWYCTNLNEVTIGNSVESIGDYAFSYCTGLPKIYIPSSLKAIGSYAFEKCSNLQGVYIDDLVSWCNIDFASSSYSNPLQYAKNLYVNDVLATDIVIPDGVEEVKPYAFMDTTCIKNVTLPEGLVSIGASAFSSCDGLRELTIPSSVTNIGNYALYTGYPVKFTFLSATPPTIGSYTFRSANISSITVPKGCGDAYKSATNWSNFASKIKEAAE